MVTTRRAALTTPPPRGRAPKRTTDAFDSQEHRNALAYVMLVKNATPASTYRTFLEALHAFQKNGRDPRELVGLIRNVAELFRDHADLLRDFEGFLPLDEDPGGAAKSALQGAVAAAEGRAAKRRRRTSP
mgnify:CR=1 FL=1|jgi:histone deacetylase complex regulatory component SIN3